MSNNPSSPLNGQDQSSPFLVDAANVAFMHAAGDDLGTPAGADNKYAPTLVQSIKAPTAPSGRVASSATSVTLLVANVSTDASTSRKGVGIYNESTQILYVRLAAAAASATAYWLQMAPSSYAEVPFGYTGEIRGIWAAANGAAMITEFV